MEVQNLVARLNGTMEEYDFIKRLEQEYSELTETNQDLKSALHKVHDQVQVQTNLVRRSQMENQELKKIIWELQDQMRPPPASFENCEFDTLDIFLTCVRRHLETMEIEVEPCSRVVDMLQQMVTTSFDMIAEEAGQSRQETHAQQQLEAEASGSPSARYGPQGASGAAWPAAARRDFVEMQGIGAISRDLLMEVPNIVSANPDFDFGELRRALPCDSVGNHLEDGSEAPARRQYARNSGPMPFQPTESIPFPRAQQNDQRQVARGLASNAVPSFFKDQGAEVLHQSIGGARPRLPKTDSVDVRSLINSGAFSLPQGSFALAKVDDNNILTNVASLQQAAQPSLMSRPISTAPSAPSDSPGMAPSYDSTIQQTPQRPRPRGLQGPSSDVAAMAREMFPKLSHAPRASGAPPTMVEQMLLRCPIQDLPKASTHREAWESTSGVSSPLRENIQGYTPQPPHRGRGALPAGPVSVGKALPVGLQRPSDVGDAWKGATRSKAPLPSDVTTLVVRNVPARCSQAMLHQMWGADKSYNILHIPYCHRTRCPIGKVFVNFVSNEAAVVFREQWQGRILLLGAKAKELDIGIAEVQGYDAFLDDMMVNSRTSRLKNKRYMPIIFDRDGNLLDFKAFVASRIMEREESSTGSEQWGSSQANVDDEDQSMVRDTHGTNSDDLEEALDASELAESIDISEAMELAQIYDRGEQRLQKREP